MKYMHLNSSCSYAGIANMLMLRGFDTEDYKIALDIDLPSHIRFDEEDGAFLSGFSLQTKKWFNFYLKPRGFEYIEESVSKSEIKEKLRPGMMLGLFVKPQQKHAVICKEITADKVIFINNKWEETDEPEEIYLNFDELTERITEPFVLGYIIPHKKEIPEMKNEYSESIRTWECLRKALHSLISETRDETELKEKMNPLFRALLLDGLTMAQLRNDDILQQKLTILQRSFLDVLRQNKASRLSEHIDAVLLDEAIDLIIEYAKFKMNEL
ncbi:MAG: hypothetical protein IJ306_00700 [Oscillospiraceae bacterium]|nr:hypothetical protein [Oscillospiraceae bacterium]